MDWFETPLGAVGVGLGAALAGTIAMTAYQYLVIGLQKLSGSGQEEGSPSPGDPWDEASAPAQVTYRLVTGVFRKPLPASRIGLVTQLTHFGYGISWGLAFGLLQGTIEAPAIVAGLVYGLAVWAAGYPPLIAMGLYKPPWRYPPGSVALEVSYHLLYGLATGLAFSGIARL